MPNADHAGLPARRRRLIITAGIALAAAVAGLTVLTGQWRDRDRQADVAARGQQVMPFDLARTTHRFSKTTTGGVQRVVAHNPADTIQIPLIRGHLRTEADKFTKGDFGDPTAIHGDQMPGVEKLAQAADRITVTYAELSDGATLTYDTTDRELVAALHAWFDAQVSDHGRHAEASG
jgi:hypothetical protein